MKFKSIEEVIKKAGVNVTAAECLGKSGAFNNLDEDLNEIEASEYARGLVEYIREEDRFKIKEEKYYETSQKKLETLHKKIKAYEEKEAERKKRYEEKLRIYQQKLIEVQSKNNIRLAEGKKPLKEPKEPSEPTPLTKISPPSNQPAPVPPTKPIKPRITLSQRERIRLQREMLNMYLSGHPLDEVSIKDNVTKIKDLAEVEDGMLCTIYGVLQSVKVTNTRKKTLMGRLRIEDKTGSIEVVAFPYLYETIKDMLTNGELYEVTGKVDITRRETDDGEEHTHIQFIGQKINTIRIGSDKEWDISYPLLKGTLHILPSKKQNSKGIATKIILNKARKIIEDNIG